MNERIIHADGIDLATEAFGDSARPPLLLIMGAMASMLWWPRAFCERLAGLGRYVMRRLVERDYDRAGNFPSITNHVMLTGGEGWEGRLHEIRAPLLVIHGTDDPIFPIEHGVALSRAAAGASIVRLDGGGHELHEADWNEITTAIVAHTRGVCRQAGQVR